MGAIVPVVLAVVVVVGGVVLLVVGRGIGSGMTLVTLVSHS